LINAQDVENQEQLVEALERHAISVTQATLSRDLREMGVTKIPKGLGRFIYKITTAELPATKKDLKNKFINFVREIKNAGNLILIKTLPGEAQGVARVIDNAKIDNILGTVAGDDTILIVIDKFVNVKRIINTFREVMVK